MSDFFTDFNPDFSDDSDNNFELTENSTNNLKLPSAEVAKAPVIVTQPNKDVMSMNNLLVITQGHMEEDALTRQSIAEYKNLLDENAHLMGIKDIIEYLKFLQRQREFHMNCIFKAYDLVQKTELAREMLIGSNRKERIIEATDRTRINRLLGMINENAVDERKDK